MVTKEPLKAAKQMTSLNGNADVDLSATSCYRQNENADVCPTAGKKAIKNRTATIVAAAHRIGRWEQRFRSF